MNKGLISSRIEDYSFMRHFPGTDCIRQRNAQFISSQHRFSSLFIRPTRAETSCEGGLSVWVGSRHFESMDRRRQTDRRIGVPQINGWRLPFTHFPKVLQVMWTEVLPPGCSLLFLYASWHSASLQSGSLQLRPSFHDPSCR